MRKTTLAVGVAVAIAAAVSCLVLTASATSEGAVNGTPWQSSGETIVIDPQVGETFTPTDPKVVRSVRVIGASEAYRRYSGGTSMPGDSGVRLGFLTLPLGEGAPGQYIAKGELVYAYTLSSCGPQLPPLSLPGSKPSKPQSPQSPMSCTQWLFVDASSGAMVDMTWTR